VLSVIDWAVRTRRINPFSALSRFFRNTFDPLLAPIERRVVVAGGKPATVPFWALLVIIVGGLLLLFLLQFVGSLVADVSAGVRGPMPFLLLLVGWGFGLLRIALIVRVLSSWLPISPYSPWIRWSYVCTEWMLRPLRSIIPLIGPIDITPLIAFFVLGFIQQMLGA
jgi:YggT family protein